MLCEITGTEMGSVYFRAVDLAWLALVVHVGYRVLGRKSG